MIWPVGRNRHRDGLVDSAQPRALGIELRIALVGPHQCVRKGFCRCRATQYSDEDNCVGQGPPCRPVPPTLAAHSSGRCFRSGLRGLVRHFCPSHHSREDRRPTDAAMFTVSNQPGIGLVPDIRSHMTAFLAGRGRDRVQHRSAMNPLISSGLAKITSARSPIIPAGTMAGAPFCGPSSLTSVLKRKLRSQKSRVFPSAVATL